MRPIRVFTDEDVYGAVAARIRAEGFDAISTPEAGRLGEPDGSQLTWAAGEGRVLVTFNVSDFARLHHETLRRGGHHAGVVASGEATIGDRIRRLLRRGRTLDAAAMRDRLEYLGNWPPT